MIKLLYKGKVPLEFRLTEKPVSRPYASPMPTGKALSAAKDDREREEILRHPDYSESRVFTLKPGLNEFKNEEWAEYLYSQLGQPDEGGSVDVGGGRSVRIVNKQILVEVDDKGNEKKDNLWVKYRRPASLNYQVEPGTELPKE